MTKCVECGKKVEKGHFISNVCELCTLGDEGGLNKND